MRVEAGPFEVECGGKVHRVSVNGETLRLHDHDVDAERTVIGLGGAAQSGCLALEGAWRRLEPENLSRKVWTALVAPEFDPEAVVAIERELGVWAGGHFGSSVRVTAVSEGLEDRLQDQMRQIASFEQAARDILAVLGSSADARRSFASRLLEKCVARWDSGEKYFRNELEELLGLIASRVWTLATRDAHADGIRWELLPPGSEPHVERFGAHAWQVGLSIDWLSDVWLSGVAHEGQFIARPTGGKHREALILRFDPLVGVVLA